LPTRKSADNVCLAIAALAAIAGLATIHRAIFAGLLAGGLVRRQRSGANHGRDNGIDNFRVPLHTDSIFSISESCAKKFHEP